MLLKFEKKLKKELSSALDNEKPNAWYNIENSLLAPIDANEAPMNIEKPSGEREKISHWILKPVRIFALVLIIAISSVSILAIANQDIRSFLLSAFSNNADVINGALVGAKSESSGFILTVDAVVPQANSFYLFFTLTDTENRLQNDIIQLKDWSFNVDGNKGWSAYIHEIKNGEPTYMVFSLSDAKKLSGKKTIDFSIESLKLYTPKSTTIDIPMNAKDLVPVKGFKINQIQAANGYVNLYLDTDVQNKDFIINSIKILNKKNGQEYDFVEEHVTQDNDSSIYKAKIISEKTDIIMDPNNYIIRVTFLEVVKIDPALKVEFTANFSKKTLSEIKLKDLYITETYNNRVIKSKLLKVIANQLSINLEFEKPKPLPQEAQQAIPSKDENSANVMANEIPILSSIHEPIETGNMSISYEDGTSIQTTLVDIEMKYGQPVSRSILLKEPLDLSRKPTLYIGDIEIELYK